MLKQRIADAVREAAPVAVAEMSHQDQLSTEL